MIADYVLDGGLLTLSDDAVAIHLCSQQPTNFADVGTFTLGNKTWAAGGAWGAPSGARTVASTVIDDGNITSDGTATHWATVDGSHLLATGPLAAPLAVINGRTFTMTSFTATLPEQ